MLDNSREAIADVLVALRLAMDEHRAFLVARGEPYEVDDSANEVVLLLREVASFAELGLKE